MITEAQNLEFVSVGTPCPFEVNGMCHCLAASDKQCSL